MTTRSETQYSAYPCVPFNAIRVSSYSSTVLFTASSSWLCRYSWTCFVSLRSFSVWCVAISSSLWNAWSNQWIHNSLICRPPLFLTFCFHINAHVLLLMQAEEWKKQWGDLVPESAANLTLMIWRWFCHFLVSCKHTWIFLNFLPIFALETEHAPLVFWRV